MIEDKYALSNSWLRGKEYREPFDYTIKDSGQTVFVKRLDMSDLLKLGIAEQLDFMSKSLMAEDKPAGEDSEQSTKDAVANAVLKAGNFEAMEKMINAVCVAGVIKPKLQEIPLHESARQPGQIYVDSVPFADRMELFSVIYDAEGLALFRPEQANGVGNVEHVSDVQLPPDRSVGIRPEDTEGVLLQQGSIPLGEDGGVGDEQSGIDEPEREESGAGNGRISEYSTVGSPEQIPGSGDREVSETG